MNQPPAPQPAPSTIGALLDGVITVMANAHNENVQRVIALEHALLRLQQQVDALQAQIVAQLRAAQAAEDRLMAPPGAGCRH